MDQNKITCPNGHPATLLYTKRVGEVDTIVCCAGCDAAR